MDIQINTQRALSHFKKVDPIMARLLEAALHGAAPIDLPTPKPPSAYFTSIVSSIISQQISTKAADAVRSRVEALLGEITPAAVLKVSDEELQQCGLSRQKVSYIRRNADIWHTLAVDDFASMPDELVITELTKLYGVGRWTAEMFLIFSLARPDVYSYGDLGLMSSLYQEYTYRKHWRRKVGTLVESWAPHRTTASLALWWHRDGGPVLL